MSFNEWETRLLGELIEINKLSLSRNNGFEVIEYYDTSSVTQNSFANPIKIGIEDAPSRAKRLVQDKDIIYSTVRPIQRHFGIIRNPKPNTVVSTGFAVLTCKSIDPYFLYYYLSQNQVVDYLNTIAEGSTTTFPAFNPSLFESFEILCPELNIQKKIAEILSTIDDKIENNLVTNQTLEEIARTLFKEWFVNFNYPNADGNLKQSEFGEIPENWEVNGIGAISFVQNGYAFKSKDFQEQGEVGIIKIKNISGNVVDIQNTDFVDASVVSSLDEKFKIVSGSLLIAMTGAEVGKIGLVPLTDKNLWLNQRVGMFKENVPFGNLYMYLLLSTDTYQTAIQNSALGSAQPNISASAIESIRAIIPPAELIAAFGRIAQPMFEKILDNLAENETLKNTRDSLLPKLMSGEIEVNG